MTVDRSRLLLPYRTYRYIYASSISDANVSHSLNTLILYHFRSPIYI